MAKAVDILPVATMKAQLTIPEKDTTHDAILEGHIAAALTELQARTKLPVIDYEAAKTFAVDGSCAGRVVLDANLPGQAEISGAKWALADGGVVDISPISPQVNAFRVDRYGRGRYRLRNAGGEWPNWSHTAVAIILTMKFGMAAEDVPASLVQGAVILARDFYFGENSRFTDQSLDRIIAPLIKWGGAIRA